MKGSLPPAQRRRYDAALRAEVLRLVGKNRSTSTSTSQVAVEFTTSEITA